MIRYWWVGLVILAAGFLGGRCSVPGVSAELLARADSLAHSRQEFTDERLRRLSTADSLVSLARERDSLSAHAARDAERLRNVGRRERARAEGLALALATAQTATDSVPILVAQVGSLTVALDSTEAAADSFQVELVRSRLDVSRLVVAVDTLGEQVRADSVRLKIAEDVIGGLRRAHSGCKYFGKVRCLRGSVSYDATDGGVLATAVYPVSDLIGVGVSYRVTR